VADEMMQSATELLREHLADIIEKHFFCRIHFGVRCDV